MLKKPINKGENMENDIKEIQDFVMDRCKETQGCNGTLSLSRILSMVRNKITCSNCNGGGSYLGACYGVAQCENCGGDGHNLSDIDIFDFLDKKYYDEVLFTAGTRVEEIIKEIFLDYWVAVDDNSVELLFGDQEPMLQRAIAGLLGYKKQPAEM